jgi:hypothetical protein
MINDMKTGNKPVIFLFLLVLLSTMLIAPSAAQTLPERVYVSQLPPPNGGGLQPGSGDHKAAI